MKVFSVAVLLLFLAACSSSIQCSDHNTVAGPRTYCVGKVAGDGQEGVFRDVYAKDRAELTHFGSGQSLAGQVLQGAASSALIAGGMVGSAAVLRPTRINNRETNNLSNDQDQGQLQLQGQQQEQSATAVSVSEAKAKAGALNFNANQNETKIGDIGGGSGGGVPGCQKAKNGC